ncbi:MAG: DUF1501 domain-containing protein [Polyangiaceae bacterium]
MKTSRRNFLLGGLATAGALAAPIAIGSRRAVAASNPKHLVTVFASGGWDTTYTLDPKPGVATIDAPNDGAITTYGGLPIYTSAARPSVAKFFERYGSIACVVNGVQMRAINHPDCSKRILTGTASEANPDMGSISAYELGRDRPAPYLVLGPSAVSGPFASIAARAGSVNQIRSLLTPTAALPKAAPFSASKRFAPDDAEAGLIKSFIQARANRLKQVNGRMGYNAARYDDFLSSLERRDVLKTFADGFGDDFTFTLDLREQIKLGLTAIERGVAWSLHLEQAFGSWDTHTDNTVQNTMNEDLYDALTVLGDELAARPGEHGGSMLDDTVVAVVSEMGRTPQLNAANGKDHWPVTSALLFGAGVAGGRVLGATDDQLQAMNVDLTTGEARTDGTGTQLLYTNLAAGILSLVGAPTATYFPSSEAFHAIRA